MNVDVSNVSRPYFFARVGRRVAAAALAVGASAAGVAAAAPASATYTVKADVVTIAAVRVANFGACVNVVIKVKSDAGQPTGSVNFLIDGSVQKTMTVPASGTMPVPINCGTTGVAARTLTPSASGPAIENAAYVLQAVSAVQPVAATNPLTVGEHTLTAKFVPTGGWAAGTASRPITILGAGSPSGLPGGVDAGLASFGSSDLGERIAISGAALALGAGMVFFYRRSAVRESAHRC